MHFLVDPNTPTYHAKVRKDGTRFAEDYIENMPIHQGIFVDVFPYDKTADDEECRKKHMSWHGWHGIFLFQKVFLRLQMRKMKKRDILQT